jgi:hypothetical protein
MTEQENYENEMKEIKKNPYKYICDFAEFLYPKTGRKVFEILSLMPVSLIIPDLPYDNKLIRSNIHCLFLAPSGSGKTSLAKLFASFTYNPIEIESSTAFALERTLSQNEVSTLIVGDFARMGRDPIIIKIVEGALGEEKRIQRQTGRGEIDKEVEITALICGVATDLHFYILGGLIFRTIPILLGHNREEHSFIGEHIMNRIGSDNSNSNIKEKVIKDFYNSLAKIQEEKNPNPLQVSGYFIENQFKKKLLDTWTEMTSRIVKEIGFNWFRELQESMRVLVAHAFLNVNNRKVEKGILYPNEEDFNVALKTMRKNIIFKYRLMKTESMAKGIKNSMEFQSIMQSNEISEDSKTILRNLVKFNK